MKKATKKRVRERTRGMFTAVPHVVLRHPCFINCSNRGKALLFDLMAQVKFDGHGGWANNGDLVITSSAMRERGWKSRDQLYAARDDLIDANLIFVTRPGGRNRCALYAITWEPINDIRDQRGNRKIDVAPTRGPAVDWRIIEG